MNEIKPLLEFPCSFLIKIVGVNLPDLIPQITAIITKHCPSFNPAQDMTYKNSKQSNYISISATITADSKQQLDAIYTELNQNKLVKITL